MVLGCDRVEGLAMKGNVIIIIFFLPFGGEGPQQIMGVADMSLGILHPGNLAEFTGIDGGSGKSFSFVAQLAGLFNDQGLIPGRGAGEVDNIRLLQDQLVQQGIKIRSPPFIELGEDHLELILIGNPLAVLFDRPAADVVRFDEGHAFQFRVVFT